MSWGTRRSPSLEEDEEEEGEEEDEEGEEEEGEEEGEEEDEEETVDCYDHLNGVWCVRNSCRYWSSSRPVGLTGSIAIT